MLKGLAKVTVLAVASMALTSPTYASGGYSGGFRPPVTKKPANPPPQPAPSQGQSKKKKSSEIQTSSPLVIG